VKLRRRQTGIDTPLTDRMVIGRLKDCQLTIEEASVSRRHARVERRGDQWWLIDLNSSNGVALNGLQMPEFQIQVGDLITFGAVAFDVLAIPKQRSEIEVETVPLPEARPAIPSPQASQTEAVTGPAELERARLHRELRSSKHASGLGDLSQQPLWMQGLALAVGLLVVYGVVLGVRWLMAAIAPTG
jgi:predicted component of type VI protein secretion system